MEIAAFNIISGFFTFTLGQIAIKLVIEPIHQLKTVISNISHSLVRYRTVFSSPHVHDDQRKHDVYIKLNDLSAELQATKYSVPCYKVSRIMFGLPTEANINLAHKRLIDLANGVYGSSDNIHEYNIKANHDISDALGLYVFNEERLDDDTRQ